MAEFYAYRIMCGKTTFSKAPRMLKNEVREILKDEGLENLTE